MTDDNTRSEENPVLFASPNGRLWLLYTAQLAGNPDSAEVRRCISDDDCRWGTVDTMCRATDCGVFISPAAGRHRQTTEHAELVAVVIGISSCLGEVIALRLLDGGWVVAGVSRRRPGLVLGPSGRCITDQGWSCAP